jgi:hypothetical protein
MKSQLEHEVLGPGTKTFIGQRIFYRTTYYKVATYKAPGNS